LNKKGEKIMAATICKWAPKFDILRVEIRIIEMGIFINTIAKCIKNVM